MSAARTVVITADAPSPALEAPGRGVRRVVGPSIPGASGWAALILEGLSDVPSVIDEDGADVITVPDSLADGPALVITDVDSTLIMEEVIEELAERAGTREQVAAVTARAMNGKLDFAESLHARVATLAGVPATVFDEVLAEIHPTPGAQEMVDAVHALGGRVGVVSGGFEEVVGPLCTRMGIDHFVANRLEVVDGVLTGRVLGRIVTAEVKVEKVHEWSTVHGFRADQVIAVGDGANDVPMLRAAGLGIAFCAKPAVREQVSAQLNIRRLDAITATWL